jgi:predicted transcriptional regulator of viral defense system
MMSIPTRRERFVVGDRLIHVLADHLRHHDGVITLAQAIAYGLSESAVHRRTRSGQWRRLSPGVFFVDDREFTAAARVRAGVWGYGKSATASGTAAAWWHGLLTKPPDIVEVTVARTATGRARDGVRLRRRDLCPTDVVDLRGLRVTALALTVVEAAVRPGGGPKVMDRALQRHIELSPLWRAHVRNKGRYGSPRARILLQGASDNTHSRAERRLVQLMRHARLRGLALQPSRRPVPG